METETHQASENMKLFFKNLLSLKEYAKALGQKGVCESIDSEKAYQDIYERLDAIIKEEAPK